MRLKFGLTMLHLRHALQQQCNPLGGSIDQKIRQEIKVVQVSPSNRAVACSFTHTYVVTRDALPISHVQTIHHSSRGSTAHRLTGSGTIAPHRLVLQQKISSIFGVVGEVTESEESVYFQLYCWLT